MDKSKLKFIIIPLIALLFRTIRNTIHYFIQTHISDKAASIIDAPSGSYLYSDILIGILLFLIAYRLFGYEHRQLKDTKRLIAFVSVPAVLFACCYLIYRFQLDDYFWEVQIAYLTTIFRGLNKLGLINEPMVLEYFTYETVPIVHTCFFANFCYRPDTIIGYIVIYFVYQLSSFMYDIPAFKKIAKREA